MLRRVASRVCGLRANLTLIDPKGYQPLPEWQCAFVRTHLGVGFCLGSIRNVCRIALSRMTGAGVIRVRLLGGGGVVLDAGHDWSQKILPESFFHEPARSVQSASHDGTDPPKLTFEARLTTLTLKVVPSGRLW